jgi:hypothetical protein
MLPYLRPAPPPEAVAENPNLRATMHQAPTVSALAERNVAVRGVSEATGGNPKACKPARREGDMYIGLGTLLLIIILIILLA